MTFEAIKSAPNGVLNIRVDEYHTNSMQNLNFKVFLFDFQRALVLINEDSVKLSFNTYSGLHNYT